MRGNQNIGQKLMATFDGFQWGVVTHTDRKHIHNHIVLNSVNYKTGLKWQQSKKDLQLLKDKSDQLCRDYGLSVIEKGKGWKSYGENRANYSDVIWKRRLAETVAESIGRRNTSEEFIHYLKDEGIEVNFLSNSMIVLKQRVKLLYSALAIVKILLLLHKEAPKVVQIQFTNIYSFDNKYEISDSGKSTFTSTLTARNVDEVAISCYLQQYSNGKWRTLKNWSGEYNGVAYVLSKSWYVASGYSYRLKSYVYVYKDGAMIESDSYTSSNIFY